MSFLGSPVSQARKPFAEVLPDGRKRLTRFFKINQTSSNVPVELDYPVKTPDPWDASPDGAPVGWTGLLLTYKQMRDSERGFPQGAQDDKPICQLIFEQISATAETQTFGTPQTQLPDGRKQVEFTYVMFSSSTYTPQVPGTTAAPAPFATYFLWEEETTDDGTLRTIKRTYQTAGTTATDDESLQGGALLLKKITSFYTVPATPAGYTSVGTPVQNPNGYPIYTYTFAKGSGEVSRRYVDSQGGTTPFNATIPSSSVGALRCIITYLTDKSVTTNPTTGPTSFVFIGQEIEDRDGYRLWTVTYGYGTGLITDETDIRVAGGWVLYHRIQFGSAPSTPAATVGGTVTLFQSETRNSDGFVIYDYHWTEGHTISATSLGSGLVVNDLVINATGTLVTYHRIQFGGAPTAPAATIGGSVVLIRNNQRQDAGFIIYDYLWAEGNGLISETITTRNDGLREVTDIALGTKSTPSGVVIHDSYRISEGYTIYTVTSMQAADGITAITSVTYSVERYLPFTYPGRAKPYSATYGAFTLLDVFKSPPVTTLISATVTISYQTTNTLGTISNFWNPLEWATINAKWISFGNNPHNLVESLPGYRATTTTAVTATCSGTAPINLTIFGNPVYGGTTASVQTTGGPVAPDANTYTLSAELEEKAAFISTTGTAYYRKVLITATIPSQPALPV